MARRAQQGVSIAQIGTIAVVVAAVAGGIAFTLSRSGDSMRAVSELNITDYVQKGDSMGGTEWRITGTVESKLRWTPDRGQLLSVFVEQGNIKESLPVLVPPEFNDVNINVGDRLTLVVQVADEQVLEARDLKRS